jgi:hypothetical protein
MPCQRCTRSSRARPCPTGSPPLTAAKRPQKIQSRKRSLGASMSAPARACAYKQQTALRGCASAAHQSCAEYSVDVAPQRCVEDANVVLAAVMADRRLQRRNDVVHCQEGGRYVDDSDASVHHAREQPADIQKRASAEADAHGPLGRACHAVCCVCAHPMPRPAERTRVERPVDELLQMQPRLRLIATGQGYGRDRPATLPAQAPVGVCGRR